MIAMGGSKEAIRKLAGIPATTAASFRPTQEGNLCEKFLAVQQEGTVAEFQRAFEVLATMLKGIPDEVPKRTFVNGLRPEIRAEVCLLGQKDWAKLWT